MARPTNELLRQARANFDKLLQFVELIPEAIRNNEFDLNGRDKTISDVICHLHEWNLMMTRWYETGMAGGEPEMPGAGYTWKTLPAFNRIIWERYKGTPLYEALTLFKDSYKKVIALIEKHTDEELFTKKQYTWTGSTSLGAYFISATSSHYDWGLVTLKPVKKLLT